MKKLLAVLLGVLVLAGCAEGETEKDSQQDTTVEEKSDEAENTKEDATEEKEPVDNNHLKEFPEYDVLAEELDLDQYEGKVESDNKGNRIILFETKDGVKEYKSIFIKNKNRLKIVEFDDEDNLLYNGVIDKEETDSSDSKDTVDNEQLKDFPEYDVLAEELDLDQYEGKVESDNKGNRIILFETKDGVKEYKSIFIKNKNRLKIVHFDDEDDLLYDDVIK